MNVPKPDPTAEGEDDKSGGPAAAAPVTRRRTPVSRKVLDDVFGDVLPTKTRDELDDSVRDAGRAAERDSWYEDNRPPHHG